MNPEDVEKEVRETFQKLHKEDASKFNLNYRISSNPRIHAVVEGERKDSERWGENKYTVDARVHIYTTNEDNWEETQSKVDEFTEKVKHALSESVGFTGPVIVRSNDDYLCRSWARRLIKTKDPKTKESES